LHHEIYSINRKREVIAVAEKNIESKSPVCLVEVVNDKWNEYNRHPPSPENLKIIDVFNPVHHSRFRALALGIVKSICSSYRYLLRMAVYEL
jgi:hypothetical protein